MEYCDGLVKLAAMARAGHLTRPRAGATDASHKLAGRLPGYLRACRRFERTRAARFREAVVLAELNAARAASAA